MDEQRPNSVPMASDSETASQLSPKRPNQTPNPGTSPNKRPKTLIQAPNSPPSSSSKGKDKIDDGSTTIDSESQSCGICLSDDGRAIRGRIDSCDHYFCFVCIMEWAKVESRCPMCKRRFSTIHRSPKDGVFLTERVVNVPVRDQIYHCFGNTTVETPDPYSEVQCTVCDSARDECLLLLCDLCDSATHTYCAGLGATVPEGDWFCQDCTVSKAQQDKGETDTDCNGQTSFRNFHKRPLAEACVSIRDIVRESRFREVERPSSTLLPHANQLPSPHVAPTATTATGLGARTLRRCRNVHGRIQVLRENWNAFRSGSLSFSSGSVHVSGNTNQRHSSGAILCDRSDQGHSTPCSSQHLAAQRGSSCDTIPNGSSYDVDKAWKLMDMAKSTEQAPERTGILAAQRGSSCDTISNRSSYDADKAWKMMDAAKSMAQAHERTSVVHQASKHPLGKVNTPIENANTSPSLLASSSKPPGAKDLVKTGPQKLDQCYSLVKGNDRRKSESQIVVKQKQSVLTTKGISNFGESFPSAQSQRQRELPSSRKVQPSVQVDVYHGNVGKLSEENLPEVSSDPFNEHDGSASLISPAGSVTAAPNTSCAKLDISSSSKLGLPHGKATMEKSCAGSKSRRDDDAKSEIQSLVKLNLKLLTRERKLGVDAFKEIARLATHSILAACGLEHPKPGVRSFPSSVCYHTNQVQQLRMSTLMPSSCRECFYVFVNDVVNAIMVEKVGSAQLSR